MKGQALNMEFVKTITNLRLDLPPDFSLGLGSADKGVKFKGGPRERPDLQKVNKPETLQGKSELFKKGGSIMATKMGKPVMKPGMDMAKDGMKKSTPMAKPAMLGNMMGMKKGGAPMKKMAAGGLSSGHKSANGVATKGKTKGTQISMPGNKGMKSGGMAKKYC